ncbi:MAG: SDR family NAD(P)-dependent oxidoreductase [Anaerolineae bacterium]|jgi:FlaA1/EpsC-like NDP-sugar epimerase
MKKTVNRLCRACLAVRNRHLLLWDLLWQPLVVLLALALRTDAAIPRAYVGPATAYALLLLVLRPWFFWGAGVYRQMWRYASLREVQLLLAGVGLASLCTALLFYGLLIPLDFVGALPRSLPLIELGLAIAAAATPRLLLRLASRRVVRAHRAAAAAGARARALIAGAGQAGTRVLYELQDNPQLPYEAVGFVDDDPAKHGLEIGGCRVLGACDHIPHLAALHGIGQIIIAMPSASGAVIRRINELCARFGLEVVTLPGTYELLSGDVSVSRLRKVEIQDLLRRAPVSIDRAQVASIVSGQRILVTGGGGSIGSEICRQLCECGPAHLTVLGHGENSLYAIGQELQRRYPQVGVSYVVADIRDRRRLQQVFAAARPEMVFHAAAHKHVPLMEDNLPDAISNNVLGTRRVLEACRAFDVPRLLMISSDKAVNPTSIMGVTKRVAELLVQDAALDSGNAYVVVRFGNVLGSRGSVVPLFQAQIAAGGPVTVTHPEMMRYFMTIPEAVQLVLEAACLGAGGETFVLDMGEPVRIADLARDLIRLSGLRPDEDIALEYVGLRPGEKLFEELSLNSEAYAPSPHPKIFVLREHRERRLAALSGLPGLVDALIAAAREGDDAQIRALLNAIVPEYSRPELAPTRPAAPAASRATPRPARPQPVGRLASERRS